MNLSSKVILYFSNLNVHQHYPENSLKHRLLSPTSRVPVLVNLEYSSRIYISSKFPDDGDDDGDGPASPLTEPLRYTIKDVFKSTQIYKERDGTNNVLFLRWFNSQCHFFLQFSGSEFLTRTVGLSAHLPLCVKWELQPFREAEHSGRSGNFSLQEMKTDELIRKSLHLLGGSSFLFQEFRQAVNLLERWKMNWL